MIVTSTQLNISQMDVFKNAIIDVASLNVQWATWGISIAPYL